MLRFNEYGKAVSTTMMHSSLISTLNSNDFFLITLHFFISFATICLAEARYLLNTHSNEKLIPAIKIRGSVRQIVRSLWYYKDIKELF